MLAILADAQLSRINPVAPVHLTGGSSGGYMTNWLVSHADVFSSAVTERSICNLVSYYGTSDIGYPYTDIEHGGNPWHDFGLLWEQSPLKYAADVRAPMRILHAEQDHRCPISQAEEWFVALRRIGHVPVELVRFPDEGHELSRSGRPDRRVARLELIVSWFEQHGTVGVKSP
jgi:dipeptidyl aminopeptidase/acylaminoacyl peptidase